MFFSRFFAVRTFCELSQCSYVLTLNPLVACHGFAIDHMSNGESDSALPLALPLESPPMVDIDNYHRPLPSLEGSDDEIVMVPVRAYQTVPFVRTIQVVREGYVAISRRLLKQKLLQINKA